MSRWRRFKCKQIRKYMARLERGWGTTIINLMSRMFRMTKLKTHKALPIITNMKRIEYKADTITTNMMCIINECRPKHQHIKKDIA
jgi:hypothetical protein